MGRKTKILLMALACLTLMISTATPAAAAPKYVKSVSEIKSGQRYILEAADYQTGYVAAPDTRSGYIDWMTLVKYKASTAEKQHVIWQINNQEQGWLKDPFGGDYLAPVTAPTYTISNQGPQDPSSTRSATRYITYTKQGFYWLPENYVDNPRYERGSDPAQRWTIKKVGTKDGKTVFRIYNEQSKLSLAAGGWGRFYIRIV